MPLEPLREASARAGATSALHDEYRSLRGRLFDQLRRSHGELPAAAVLGVAQTVLDRVVFIAFAEGRGLLPGDTFAGRDGQDPEPGWHRLKRVFGWLEDRGFFRPEPALERIAVSDALWEALARLSRYDFRETIPVEVLGDLFERSIGELEALRRESEGGAGAGAVDERTSKRHDQGVYYTPADLTRDIVDRTLGRTLTERREAIFGRQKPGETTGKDRIAAWEAYRGELKRIRVLDPACGSGAFLVAACDALGREHERVHRALAELGGGQIGRFALEETVLRDNLFGVDLDPESVEIARRSLWLKTAQYGRRSPSLDSHVRCGDSLVDAPRGPDVTGATDIDARFRDGFDVVLGNPPYIRNELFAGRKDDLKRAYATYHGMADLYVYFFERGLSVLKPRGRLGFIVSNKWLRAGYAAQLRRLLAGRTEIESLVDFGHATLFKDADTSPCVISLRKLAEGEAVPSEHHVSVTAFPCSERGKIGIRGGGASQRYAVPQRRLGEEAWNLEPAAVEALYRKINTAGTPLCRWTGVRPQYGIKTGYNDAFLIDTATRDELVRVEPAAAGLIKKYLRGQDIGRWRPAWAGLWVILLKSSGDHAWPWATLAAPEAERCFAAAYPRLFARIKPMEDALRRRTDKGRFWWELRSCGYYDAFLAPKIHYQEIQFHPSYGLDREGFFLNNKGFFLGDDDPWLLGVLNSPLMWWHNWRYLGHMKDETLSPAGVKMERLPIASPDDEARRAAEEGVPRLVAFVQEDGEARAAVLDALKTEMQVDAPGQKLRRFEALSRDGFLAEVTRRRPRAAGRLTPAGLTYLRAVYDQGAIPIQDRRRRALALEKRLAERVNGAYQLTPDEVALLWATAPPRMPAGR